VHEAAKLGRGSKLHVTGNFARNLTVGGKNSQILKQRGLMSI